MLTKLGVDVRYGVTVSTIAAWLLGAWERAVASSGAKVELGASAAACVYLQGSIDWSTSSLRTRW